jgi:hypothetical protein
MKCSFASVSKTEIAYYLNLFNVIHFDPCRTLILINSCFLMFSHSFTMSSTGLWQKASLVSPFERATSCRNAMASDLGTGSWLVEPQRSYTESFRNWKLCKQNVCRNDGGPGCFSRWENAKNRHKTLVTRGLNSLRRRWREKERERERERGDLFFNDPNSCESRMGRTLEEKHWETDHFSASWCHRNMWAMRGPFQVKA